MIAVAVMAAYAPALRCGFIWDDDSYVTANDTLNDWAGLVRIWFHRTATPQYYPLVFSTFWLEHHLWGDHALGYHLVNIFWHAASCVLLWRLLLRFEVRGALAAALVFAVHPVHVESVAWITERKNVLSGLFFLASLSAYLRYSGLGERVVRRNRRVYAAALLLFVAALLSKTVTATMPAAILIVLWWKRERLHVGDVWPLVPFVVLGALAAGNTSWIERHHVGTEFVDWQLGAADRIVLAGRVLWFYVCKLVWPAELIFIYPRWRIDAAQAVQWAFAFAWVALVVVLFLFRRRLGKAPAAAILYFTATLGPVLGFVNVYPMRFSFVADHFQYLASGGPIVLIVGVVATRFGHRIATWAASIVVVTVLTVLTWRQIPAYRDVRSIWTDTIEKNNSAWIAYGNLAADLAVHGERDEAIELYHAALRLKHDAPQVHLRLADLLAEAGRTGEAVASYEAALAHSPTYAEAHNNLGLLLAKEGKPEAAEDHYRAALAAMPDYGDALNNLANLRRMRGDAAEAIALYRRAIAAQPDHAVSYLNLASALMAEQPDEAIDAFRTAVRLDPASYAAHDRLAVLLAGRGETDEAIGHWKSALAARPGHFSALYNLGFVYLRLGDRGAAVEYLERAVRVDPANQQARRALQAARRPAPR